MLSTTTTAYTDSLSKFDGATPTCPEWARELRAYLNISQFEYINLFDFAYDAEDPLTTDIMVLQTEAGGRQGAEIQRLRNARQELEDEFALPPAERQDLAVIDPEIQQVTNDISAQQVLQDATTTQVRRAGELFGYLIMHGTNLVANQTTYFVDFSGPTSAGKCFDNSDISMLQELVYNSTPCYRALYIHNFDGQRHHNNNFRSGCTTFRHTR